MNNYFGTDGIRGIVNETLTTRVAFSLGNALCQITRKPNVFIGRDNRVTSDMLMLAIGAGITSGGGNVIDGGVIPTAACAYLTVKNSADYGVMISASHNPPKFNGIKIFDKFGCKLSEQNERRLERYFIDKYFASPLAAGKFILSDNSKNDYINRLCDVVCGNLCGLHFVLDCANGAASGFAPTIFMRLGAKVTTIGINDDGAEINKDCGALHPKRVCELVKSLNADAGFCYDGDSDRLIAVDEKGCVVDGDKIICIFADKLKKQNKLNNDTVVGTTHTNTGAEIWLSERGIKLIRTDIGDKFVAECMRSKNLSIGGEQSGHIILSEYSTTGDGILSSLKLAELIKDAPLSVLADISFYPQYNTSVKVKDKTRVLGDETVAKTIREVADKLGKGRIVVRASGTEPVIRIFTEAENFSLAKRGAEQVRKVISLLKE